LSNGQGTGTISHLVKGEYGNVRNAGGTFNADFPASADGQPYNRMILFEEQTAGQPSTFYKYTQRAVDAGVKSENELNKMLGTAPAGELYQKYIDLTLTDSKTLLADLEARKISLEAEIQNGPTRTVDGSRNSSDVYTELREVTRQIEQVKAEITNLETSKAEMAKVFGDAVGKPIPLQAVLVARENGQTIPLQLYAKNMGDGKWAIIDATNPAKPRSYVGEGILPTDALNAAWKNFTSSTNDLPAGQIAAVKPKGLGLTKENEPWNAQSAGKSTLKQFADGLGKGSMLTAGAGLVLLAVPGAEPLGAGLLLSAGVGGGVSSAANLADRINNGTFELESSETAFDMLGIIGGISSLGGLAAITGAGAKGLSIIAGGTKFNVQKVGDFVKITSQVVEQGTNTAGGILIGSQYVSAMEQVQKSGMTADQKAAEIRKIISSAFATGGAMVLGVGLARKLRPATQIEQPKNWKEIEGVLGKSIKVGEKLPEGYKWNGGQIHRNNGNVDAGYAKLQVDENGKIALSQVERLSNPNTMNKNFLNKVRAEYSAKGLTGEALENAVKAEKVRVQVHHIIPDELIQKSNLGKAAQKAGYNLDEGSNLIGLPRSNANKITPNEIGHWTNHKDYTKLVQKRLKDVEDNLIRKYKSLDKVPPKEIKEKMRELENEFRNLIKKSDKSIPTKDGRLSFAPINQTTLGGRYEIRA
jgi:hypothetical protein